MLFLTYAGTVLYKAYVQLSMQDHHNSRRVTEGFWIDGMQAAMFRGFTTDASGSYAMYRYVA